MRNIISFVVASLALIACSQSVNKTDSQIIDQVNTTLDAWHLAAAEANFEVYFNAIATDGYFLGTDASENWDKKSFQEYSKPHFDKGKAWSFTPYNRNIYVYKDSQLVWFEELLKTPFGICRGSGVVCFEADKWVIKQYNLTLTIPNSKMDSVSRILN